MFSFGVMEKRKNSATVLERLGNIFSSDNEMEKSSNRLNTRSARPGISSYDYSPAYTNRLWLSWCYWYEDEVSILSDILQKIRDEVMRYGVTWKPAFAKKCNVCGEEFDDDVDECELCHSKDLREPDKMQLRATRIDQYNTFVNRANMNKQTMSEVIKTALFHMLVTDNGYILIHKDYSWDEMGNLRAFPKEFFALDPRDVIKLFDFETGFPGKGRTCLDHRSTLLGENDATCPQCGKPTFRAHFQVFTATKTSTYYIEDEICHLMYYYPSIIYGYPKALKIKDELITYHMIEKRVRNFYEFCKVPGILFIPNDDPEALHEMWQKVREETKDDPFTPAVLGVSEIAPTSANFIRLMQDPNAELISIKDDLRMRIASSYEVTIAFTNDTGQSGGLKNDKNMISLADRTIRSMQELVDNKALKPIRIAMGITDWKLECEPNINENKLESEEVRAAQINNAERLASMGLKVIWKGDNYTVGKGPLMSPEMMMMGMAPPGAGAPMPPMPMGADMGMGQVPMATSGPVVPDEMGNPKPVPEMATSAESIGELDALAAGKVQSAGEVDPEEERQQMLDSIKSRDKTKKKKKLKVSTKLSNILDELFMSKEEREKTLRESENDEGEDMMGMPPTEPGMPGMPSAPGMPGEPMMGAEQPGMAQTPPMMPPAQPPQM
jgi:hypothetical protein